MGNSDDKHWSDFYPGTASPRLSKLTHWGWDIFQTTFSNAFSFMKMFQFRLRFHWSLLFSLKNKPQWNLNRGLINNIPALVQIMAWRRPGDKPLFEPMVVSLLTHICVTRPQWVKVTWQIGILVNNAINWYFFFNDLHRLDLYMGSENVG